MITTYLFDLDGTLVPYSEREQRALAYLAQHGVTETAFKAANGQGWDNVCAGRLTLEEKWQLQIQDLGASPAVAQQFVAIMTAFEPAYADVLPLLNHLTQMGAKLGVITNGPPGAHQREKLAKAGLDHFFGDRVYISCEVGAAKPDPAIFNHALAQLGARPEQAVMVGDSLHADVLGAIAPGIRGVWLDRIGTTPTADAPRITTLADLLPLVQ